MDDVLSLLKPILESDSKDETLPNYLRSCIDLKAFSKGPSGIPLLVGSINAKLNEPSSRCEGLQLLLAFLPQCTLEVLAENANSWMQFCLKGLSVAKTSQSSFKVLGILFKLCIKIPELTKNVSSVVVPNLAEQIHKGILPQSRLCALECLEQCLDNFNGPCGPHKKVIERFLLSQIDQPDPQWLKIIWQAARCFALLPQVGGGGTGGNLYKLEWAAQQKSLCRTIHIILDELYAHTSELQVSLVGGMLEGTEPLPLNMLEHSDVVLRTQNLATRLIAVTSFLQAMLVVHFPVPKNIAVSAIMNLVCRGLAVNGNSLGHNTTTHSLALIAVLPKIHFPLLTLLEFLITVCRTNLLPYAGVICKLVVQTLKWTRVENWPYGTDRPFSSLRSQAYAVLTLWCGTAKLGSLVEDVADQLVEFSLPDIYTERGSVLLSATLSKKNKYANQKQAKRKKNTNKESSNGDGSKSEPLLSAFPVNPTANEGVCVIALEALCTLLMAASFKIQASLHKTIQETVISILLRGPSQADESLIPYSAAAPRLGLYRLLLQLVQDSHSVWPAPTNVALKLFAKGLHDTDPQVSIFCGLALSCVEKIIHPAYAPLYFQTSSPDSDGPPTPMDEEVQLSLQSAVSHDSNASKHHLASTIVRPRADTIVTGSKLGGHIVPLQNKSSNSTLPSAPVLSEKPTTSKNLSPPNSSSLSLMPCVSSLPSVSSPSSETRMKETVTPTSAISIQSQSNNTGMRMLVGVAGSASTKSQSEEMSPSSIVPSVNESAMHHLQNELKPTNQISPTGTIQSQNEKKKQTVNFISPTCTLSHNAEKMDESALQISPTSAEKEESVREVSSAPTLSLDAKKDLVGGEKWTKIIKVAETDSTPKINIDEEKKSSKLKSPVFENVPLSKESYSSPPTHQNQKKTSEQTMEIVSGDSGDSVNVEVDEPLVEAAKPKQSPKKGKDDTMIDLVDSDSEVSECEEVNLADSDNDSSISICSRSTINSPLQEKKTDSKQTKPVADTSDQSVNKPASVQPLDKKMAVTPSPVKENGFKSSTQVSVSSPVTLKNCSVSLSNINKEAEDVPTVIGTAMSPKLNLPTTPPRSLRSRTISGSSSSASTPTRKSARQMKMLEAAEEVEEMVSSSFQSNVLDIENGIPDTKKPKVDDGSPIPKKPKIDSSPAFKKPKVDDYEDDDFFEEEEMLSSFIDQVQGDNGLF